MLGLPKGVVRLEPHSEHWQRLFAEEAARLREVIGDYVLAIEHIGSTSIGGLRRNQLLIWRLAWKNRRTAKDAWRGSKISVTNIAANTASRIVSISSKASRARIISHVVLADSDFWAWSFIVSQLLARKSGCCERIREIKN
jgi:hypothetical protein